MGLVRAIISSLFLLICGIGFLMASLFISLGKREAISLPSIKSFEVRKSISASRMYDGVGNEIGRFAEQNRIFVDIKNIPPLVINAFISAEDKNYRKHHGVDYSAIIRAGILNIKNRGTGRRPGGASTITQQVAKNFLVGDDISLKRKFREVLISLRLDRDIGKDKILEIYLNEIYLGEGAYGVGAASEAWFNKPLSSLNYIEASFLAGLPKAPSAYDPRKRPDASRARRAYVLNRMAEDGVITRMEASDAIMAPLPSPTGVRLGNVATGWFPEEARREVSAKVGNSTLYKGGLIVKTSLDEKLQSIAESSLKNGLISYDRRHGYRGEIARINNIRPDVLSTWQVPLTRIEPPSGIGPWSMGVVLGFDKLGNAVIGLTDSSTVSLTKEGVLWARKAIPNGLGPAVRQVSDIVKTGDVILIFYEVNKYELKQIPEVQGNLIAMESKTGRVLAVVGGFDSVNQSFNRAVQARRQPGSTFKALIYLSAFEAGYNATSPILDAPIVLNSGGHKWIPEGGDSLGLITMRRALEQSRNLASVRLLNEVGLNSVSELSIKLGLYDKPLENYASALGAVETTNMKITASYAMMGNGGIRIYPGFVDSISDESNHILWARTDKKERVISSIASAQIVSLLQGVVKRGTASSSLSKIQLPIAGKTGTTNEDHDAWFIGLTPDLAIGIHIGFDRPENMGVLETGGMASAPIFGEFVKQALSIRPGQSNFTIPPEAKIVKVNPQTGEEDKNGIAEIFK